MSCPYKTFGNYFSTGAAGTVWRRAVQESCSKWPPTSPSSSPPTGRARQSGQPAPKREVVSQPRKYIAQLNSANILVVRSRAARRPDTRSPIARSTSRFAVLDWFSASTSALVSRLYVNASLLGRSRAKHERRAENRPERHQRDLLIRCQQRRANPRRVQRECQCGPSGSMSASAHSPAQYDPATGGRCANCQQIIPAIPEIPRGAKKLAVVGSGAGNKRWSSPRRAKD